MKTCAIALCVMMSVPIVSRAQADGEAIRSVLTRQVDAWNRGDVEEFMKGYWNSEKTSFVSGGTMTQGYQEVLGRYKKKYGTREKMGSLRFEDLTIRTMSNTAAVASGVWRLTRVSDAPWGRFTLVLEKKPEGWRIVYDHTSTAE